MDSLIEKLDRLITNLERLFPGLQEQRNQIATADAAAVVAPLDPESCSEALAASKAAAARVDQNFNVAAGSTSNVYSNIGINDSAMVNNANYYSENWAKAGGTITLIYIVGEEGGDDGPRTVSTSNRRSLSSESQPKASSRAATKATSWLNSQPKRLIRDTPSSIILLMRLPESDKYSVITLTIGRMDIGGASSVVANGASASIAVRIAEGTPTLIMDEIGNVVYTAIVYFLDDGMKAEDIINFVFPTIGYGPIDIDSDLPGFESMTVHYGTDISGLNSTVDG
ncbi:hypothetical protein LTR33_005900 [Friedmanniomyces endolithicus]|nr:hypothetical protein LTR33_005900 [Friedmanniomyces endolithicus]